MKLIYAAGSSLPVATGFGATMAAPLVVDAPFASAGEGEGGARAMVMGGCKAGEEVAAPLVNEAGQLGGRARAVVGGDGGEEASIRHFRCPRAAGIRSTPSRPVRCPSQGMAARRMRDSREMEDGEDRGDKDG